MKSLQRACGAAVIALAVSATGALAGPQPAGSVQLAAAKTQSTHKSVQPFKSTPPRKKSRCYG